MMFTLPARFRLALLLAITCSFIGCRQADEKIEVSQASPAATVAVAEARTAPRPAPEFYVIPPYMAQSRVWICIDESADVFHTKHDCPVLVACQGSFRNMTLYRAIDDFGRYNCQECSQNLDHIFDEDLVR